MAHVDDKIEFRNQVGFYRTPPVDRPEALTAPNTSTIGIVYTEVEATVMANLRTRVAEMEDRLRTLGLLP